MIISTSHDLYGDVRRDRPYTQFVLNIWLADNHRHAFAL